MFNMVGALTGLLLFTAAVAMKASRYRIHPDKSNLLTRANNDAETSDSSAHEEDH